MGLDSYTDKFECKQEKYDLRERIIFERLFIWRENDEKHAKGDIIDDEEAMETQGDIDQYGS